jgi:hypothetical protein
MSQSDQENKMSQGGQRMSYREYEDRRQELRSELRDLRHRNPYHGAFVGVLLVLIGCLFLAGMLFGFNVGQWWPVIPILVGIAMLSRVFYARC